MPLVRAPPAPSVYFFVLSPLLGRPTYMCIRADKMLRVDVPWEESARRCVAQAQIAARHSGYAGWGLLKLQDFVHGWPGFASAASPPPSVSPLPTPCARATRRPHAAAEAGVQPGARCLRTAAAAAARRFPAVCAIDRTLCCGAATKCCAMTRPGREISDGVCSSAIAGGRRTQAGSGFLRAGARFQAGSGAARRPVLQALLRLLTPPPPPPPPPPPRAPPAAPPPPVSLRGQRDGGRPAVLGGLCWVAARAVPRCVLGGSTCGNACCAVVCARRASSTAVRLAWQCVQ
eukprot:gene24042-biopygen22356